MIQVGDMVKLFDTSCKCEFCEEARKDYHKVIGIRESHIKIKLAQTEMYFRNDWPYDVQNFVQENE